jgi:hypothetical protein
LNYSVSKQFGHIVQIWHITADSEEDAWSRAEIDGKLSYQTAYRDMNPLRNYIVNLDEKKSDIVKKDEYAVWIEEAVSLGMKIPNN